MINYVFFFFKLWRRTGLKFLKVSILSHFLVQMAYHQSHETKGALHPLYWKILTWCFFKWGSLFKKNAMNNKTAMRTNERRNWARIKNQWHMMTFINHRMWDKIKPLLPFANDSLISVQNHPKLFTLFYLPMSFLYGMKRV